MKQVYHYVLNETKLTDQNNRQDAEPLLEEYTICTKYYCIIQEGWKMLYDIVYFDVLV